MVLLVITILDTRSQCVDIKELSIIDITHHSVSTYLNMVLCNDWHWYIPYISHTQLFCLKRNMPKLHLNYLLKCLPSTTLKWLLSFWTSIVFYLFIYMYLSIYLSIYLASYLSIYLSILLSIHSSIYLSIYLIVLQMIYHKLMRFVHW